MTASPSQSHHDYSFAEYLALERDSEIKHEFDSAVFQSDMRVRIAATGRATYPDASMVCGPIEYDLEDTARTTITNPILLVEVLSVTTEKGDRGNKWMHYQRIPSLAEYVLVSQEPRIEVYRRMPSGTWEYFEIREGILKLACGPALDLAKLYAELPI